MVCCSIHHSYISCIIVASYIWICSYYIVYGGKLLQFSWISYVPVYVEIFEWQNFQKSQLSRIYFWKRSRDPASHYLLISHFKIYFWKYPTVFKIFLNIVIEKLLHTYMVAAVKVFQQFFIKLVSLVLDEWLNRERFPNEFQQDVATAKVFHHKRFALYGISFIIRLNRLLKLHVHIALNESIVISTVLIY